MKPLFMYSGEKIKAGKCAARCVQTTNSSCKPKILKKKSQEKDEMFYAITQLYATNSRNM